MILFWVILRLMHEIHLRFFVFCSGPRSENPGRHAGSAGMLRQGKVVQHLGIGLESPGSSVVSGSAGSAHCSSGQLAGHVWLLRWRRIPELHEAVQQVEERHLESHHKNSTFWTLYSYLELYTLVLLYRFFIINVIVLYTIHSNVFLPFML